MDEAAMARLDAVNRKFYRSHAARFDDTRRAPWPGWERIASLVPAVERPSILDAGCGNGRFGLFLDRAGPDDAVLDYTGVDASPELLAIAASRGRPAWRLVEADLTRGAVLAACDRRYDLVACFGVLHHVAGGERRRRLIEALADRLTPGGRLAVSFWQFGNRRRFTRARLDWETVGLGPDDVEAGDFLLPWDGPDSGAARYCHWVDPAEARRLVDGLSLAPCATFLADGGSGDLNLYLVLERS